MIYYAFTFLIITILYIHVCIQKKSILNILVFNYWTYGLLMVLLYTIKLGLSKDYFEINNGDVIVILYFILYFIGAHYIITNAKPLALINLRIGKTSNTVLTVCVFFIMLFFLRNINIITTAIVNPRMFYANTRIGGGFIYYIVIPFSMLLYFIMISKIDYINGGRMAIIKAVILTSVFFGYLYIFGQKSTMFKVAFIFLTTYYYKSEKRKINIKLFKYIMLSGVALFFVAVLYFKQQRMSSENMVLRIVYYSDYLTNFSDLVKYLPHHFWGKIFVEDEFISLIPRSIWQSKPELFGSLKLGLYVPRLVYWTKAKTGAPSFGPLGQVYADFGVIGMFIKLFYELLVIWFAMSYDFKIKMQGYNFFYHWLVLTFCNIKIFTVTMTILPIYQILVIYIVYHLSKIKIRLV